MKILLTNVHRGLERHLYFPLGLGYIASPLLKDGHEVSFCDVQELEQDEIPSGIAGHDFDVVCVSALITDFKYVQWFSGMIKDKFPGTTVIVGGGLSTVSGFLLERSRVDITVCQEGEETIVELLRALKDDRDLKEVKGIFYRDPSTDTVVSTPPRAPIEDLDSIALPAYDLFEVEKYIRTDKLGFSYPVRSLSVITTRGCPYSCVFCDKGVWGGGYRARTAESILEEILWLKKKYGVDAIVFSDDLFVLNKERVHEFCDLLIKNRVDIAWSCNGRVNIMDEELLKKMQEAGCMTIAYGFETGSQRLLDIMNKKTTVEQAKRAITLTRKYHIDVQPYLVLNMIGEDEESIQMTVDFCKEMGLPVGKFGIFTPLPNTKLYEMAEKAVKMPPLEVQIEQWHDWNEDLTVNLSNLSDSRLLELKEQAETSIREYYIRHHKRLILSRLMIRYNRWGSRMAFGVLKGWVRKYLRYKASSTA